MTDKRQTEDWINSIKAIDYIITVVKTTSVGDASSVGDGLAGWPVTVGVVDTRYGVIQPGTDAER